MIQTDIFRRIGATHAVCEDYIIEGNKPFPFIILADGCSTAKNTDMGARILCHLAKQYVMYRQNDYMFPLFDYKEMGTWIIHNAELSARQLGLNVSCLNATLIISFFYKDQFHIYMYGDGTFILKKNDDELMIIDLEYTKNAPNYLQYQINSSARDDYHRLGQDLIITETLGERVVERKYAYDYNTFFTFSTELFPTLVVCSDGISSFVKDKVTRIPLEEIVPEVLAYKSTKGEFLKRRLKRALKIYDQNGIEHTDDLSVGTFLLTE
jgi:serine/threonine protein phosphatase PrpC